MTDLELLLALAQTPLGSAIAMPFAGAAVAGLHHIWTHRPRTRRELRTKRRAERARTRKALRTQPVGEVS